MKLSIDIETYSECDLISAGVFAYAEHPSTEVLCVGWAIDDEPEQLFVCDGSRLPARLLAALNNPDCTLHAFNAQFEYTLLDGEPGRRIGWPYTPLTRWRCTMAKVLAAGLPRSLGESAKALGVTDKDDTGKRVMLKLSKPRKPTKNDARTRYTPADAPEDFATLYAYCKNDVKVEREIDAVVRDLIPEEQRLWVLDQEINRRGITCDVALATRLSELMLEYVSREVAHCIRVTGCTPTQVAELMKWVAKQGYPMESMDKEAVSNALADPSCPDNVRDILKVRQSCSRSSTAKYVAAIDALSSGNRLRGMFGFHGAATGRWTGSIVQLHNLPSKLEYRESQVRDVLNGTPLDDMLLIHGDPMVMASGLTRGMLIAPPGKKFVVFDFSAIEARVLAWLANEPWRLEVFRTHGKIYEASASQMFHVPLEEFFEYEKKNPGKKHPLRFKGKVAELALGYQGGPNALITMGALKEGLTEAELPEIVQAWREANPNIKRLWYALNDAAMTAVGQKGIAVKATRHIAFKCVDRWLYMRLPSGRLLSYFDPRIEEGKFGPAVTYMSNKALMGGAKKWQRVFTSGGKLVENACQAVSRDFLRDVMFELESYGYEFVGHVHDEGITEVPDSPQFNAEFVEEVAARSPKWAPDFPLKAEAFEAYRYRK